MQHIGAPEVNEAVAVGVRRRYGEHVHLFAVQVHRRGIAVGEYRQRRVGQAVLHQTHPHPVVRQNGDAHVGEVLVAAHVVAVAMGIDDEADFAVIEFGNPRDDALGERRELIVDHDDPVCADRQPDVAAGAFQIVHPARDGVDDQLHRVPIPFLLGERGGARQEPGE